MAHQAEGLDRDPALGSDERAILEGVAQVVVRRSPIRVERTHREDGPVPRQDDEAATIRGKRKEGEGHVERQAGVQKGGMIVMGEGVVVLWSAKIMATISLWRTTMRCQSAVTLRLSFREYLQVDKL